MNSQAVANKMIFDLRISRPEDRTEIKRKIERAIDGDDPELSVAVVKALVKDMLMMAYQ